MTLKCQRLDEWLNYISHISTHKMDLSLDRISMVLAKLPPMNCRVISIAGTNGKGSSTLLCEQLLLNLGYHVGTYTSPHLIHFTERMRCNGASIEEDVLCEMFAQLEQLRGDVALTYFEFTTLAALLWFSQLSLDYVLLEVGLGGRLDAVNAITPHASLITNIAMDHMDYLGETREAIALEKAGIMRQDTMVCCADENPPEAIASKANGVGANLKLINQDYHIHQRPNSWTFAGPCTIENLPYANMCTGLAANVLCLLAHEVPHFAEDVDIVSETLKHFQNPGRFEVRGANRNWILDVGHNPAAAQFLAERLSQKKLTHMIFSMFADKDIVGTVNALSHRVDHWHVVPMNHVRGADLYTIHKALSGVTGSVQCYDDVHEAGKLVASALSENSQAILFGSFALIAQIYHAPWLA